MNYYSPILDNLYRKCDFYTKDPLILNRDTEDKTIRIAKQIFSVLLFPLGIYNRNILAGKLLICLGVYKLLQAFAGMLIIPVSLPSFISDSFTKLNDLTKTLTENAQYRATPLEKNEFGFQRFTMEIDGYQIDGCLLAKPSTKENGRWILCSNGNAETYESGIVYGNSFTDLLSSLKANGIVFNYPGVGASSGLPNRQAMVKAYCAMLNFLEDKEKGIGAKEIVGYGFSVGAGVQGEALKSHPLKEGIKYVFIKDRTFSSLHLVPGAISGYLVKLLGWNMDSVTSSKRLQATEIILQTAHVETDFQKFTSINDLAETDKVITKEASLAYKLLKAGSLENKHFLGIMPSLDPRIPSHCKSLDDISPLVEIVNRSLAASQDFGTEQAS